MDAMAKQKVKWLTTELFTQPNELERVIKKIWLSWDMNWDSKYEGDKNMDTFNFVLDFSNSIIAFANIVLIVFIFLQLRDARKPLISTTQLWQFK